MCIIHLYYTHDYYDYLFLIIVNNNMQVIYMYNDLQLDF